MKRIQFLIAISVLAASCSGSNTGSSTPIDSVNINGTAPVEYGSKGPNDVNHPLDPDSRDTGMKSNTMNYDDSVREGLRQK